MPLKSRPEETPSSIAESRARPAELEALRCPAGHELLLLLGEGDGPMILSGPVRSAPDRAWSSRHRLDDRGGDVVPESTRIARSGDRGALDPGHRHGIAHGSSAPGRSRAAGRPRVRRPRAALRAESGSAESRRSTGCRCARRALRRRPSASPLCLRCPRELGLGDRTVEFAELDAGRREHSRHVDVAAGVGGPECAVQGDVADAAAGEVETGEPIEVEPPDGRAPEGRRSARSSCARTPRGTESPR